MNPKVKVDKLSNNRLRLIFSLELVKALQMVYNSLRWDFGAQCVRFILKRALTVMFTFFLEHLLHQRRQGLQRN